MKYHAFLIVVLLAALMPQSVSAAPALQVRNSDRVVKTACAYAFGYEDIDQLKADLLIQAKQLAINELFGEFITASTAVENSVVTSDEIRTSSMGYVRVEGDIAYQHGENLAEVCVTIVAYATDEDREQFAPIKLNKRHCVTDPNLTTSEIREYAKEEVLVQALIDYESALRDAARSDILRLFQRVKYLQSGFVSETETYCVTAEGTVIPIEIMAYVSSLDETLEDPANTSGERFLDTDSGKILVHPVEVEPRTAVIHYHRPDGDYSGWALHVWVDVREPEVSWDRPLAPSGTTESSIYFVVDLLPDARRVGFIVHKGGLKDPGPDMFLNLEQDGYQVWMVSGDDRVYTIDTTE